VQHDGPTLCEDCDHVIRDKNTPPFRWLCCKHKKLEGFGWVTRTTWDNGEPYARCSQINHGACPNFVKASPGQMRMGEMVGEVE
jgi:hypothetical protein